MNSILAKLVEQEGAFKMLEVKLDLLSLMIDDVELAEQNRKVINEQLKEIFELMEMVKNGK